MDCVLFSKEPLALVNNMDSYFKETNPDCSLFSQDNCEIPIHKELLYQTKFMRSMIKSLNMDSCLSKIEIMCPSLTKDELEIIVKFLYSGEISCVDHDLGNEVSNSLTQLFGFPSIDGTSNSNQDFQEISVENTERKQSLTSLGLVQYDLPETIIKDEMKDSDEKNVSIGLLKLIKVNLIHKIYFCRVFIF